MEKEIKYETIKNGYITKSQAIAIAGCDRNLKDSIFKKWKKESKMTLGWISFNSFDVALVKIGRDYAWHIKVKSGDWGATKGFMHMDGEFTEDMNISCIVMCDSGAYCFCDDFDVNSIQAPDMKEYNDYIKRSSIFHN